MQSSRRGGSSQSKRNQPGSSTGSASRSGDRTAQRPQGGSAASSSSEVPTGPQASRQRARAQQQQPFSTQGIVDKIQTLREDSLRQIGELLRLEPSADSMHLLDVLLEDAGIRKTELEKEIEVCMDNDQVNLVGPIFEAIADYEAKKTEVERMKARYQQTGGAPPADSRHQQHQGMEEQEALRQQEEDAQRRREAEEAQAAVFRQREEEELAARQRQEEEARRAEQEARHAAQLEAQREEEARIRQQAEAARAMQQPPSLTFTPGVSYPQAEPPPVQRSAIEEAQRRSGGLEEQSDFQVPPQRFPQAPLVPPEVLPPPENFGNWPSVGSDGAGFVPPFPGVGGSDVIPEARNNAEHMLRTTLQGEMREDLTVLQWAVAEAQKAGVALSDPALMADGERQLEQASFAARTQVAMHELETALASDTRTAESVREAVEKAHFAGLTPVQTAPARTALAALESRELELKQAEQRCQEAIQEIRVAEHGGDPVKLEAAMERAREEGAPEDIIEGAEKTLRAMRFLMKLRKHTSEGPLLNAWRRHIQDVKSARALLKDALVKGVHAETLEERIDDARETGVDGTTCDMAQTVANHRKSAHQQAEHALASKDLEELREAKSMNTAAGGPKADVARLDFALAEAEEDERMLQEWDVHLPAAVDGYFEMLETQQRGAKELQTGLANLRTAHGVGASTPPTAASKASAKAGSQVAATPKVKAGEQSSTPRKAQQAVPKAVPPKAVAPVMVRPTAKREEEEEWEREYQSMKSQVEHARQRFALQEQQRRHEEQLKKLERLQREEEEREASERAAEERRRAAEERRQHPPEEHQKHEGTALAAKAPPSKDKRSGTPRRSRWSLCGNEEDNEPETQAPPVAKAPIPQPVQTHPGPAAAKASVPQPVQTHPGPALPSWQTAFQRRQEAELVEASSPPTQERAQHSAPNRQQGEQHAEQQRQHMQRTHSARSVCPGFGSHSRKNSHSPAPSGREVAGGRLETECPTTPLQHEQQQWLRQQQQQQQQQQLLQEQRQQQQQTPLRGVPTASSGQANPFATQTASGTWSGPCQVPGGTVPAASQPVGARGYSLSGSVPADSKPAAARGCHSSGSVLYAGNSGVSGLSTTASLWPPHSASHASGGAGSKLSSASNWAPPASGLPPAGGSRGISGADAGAGCGLDLKGYGNHRGTNTFYDLMANASDIARRPGTEPRRHYEDHSFWRH